MQLFQGITAFSGKVAIKSSWKSIAQQTISHQHRLEEFSEADLRKECLSLRYQVRSGCPSSEVIVQAFALVREAARRSLSMQHYPVQLMGGAAMADGTIAVMQTGEGKTLTATLPLFLAALTGKGAHLATANDYLAARDAELMSPLFALLGMTVGVVEQKTETPDRRNAYSCDITYTTAKEIGFDFLRDRLKKRRVDEAGITNPVFDQPIEIDEAGSVQRTLHFMLVDEADSILIDEARTPLIISSVPEDLDERRALYQWAAESSGHLDNRKHFVLDDETRSIHLTAAGRTLARKIHKPPMLSRTALTDIYDQLELALLVEEKFIRERHYVIRDGEVVIVDEFTGRMAEGRKWRAGLHQAIEARENLEVTCETSESARMTIQDLFLKYDQICGMTGTVANSARELNSIYSTPVAHIPTNKPPKRKHFSDLVFGSEQAKWQAIVEEIKSLNQIGRPVLVGTRSIDKSELLSILLTNEGIEHQVLNAKHLENEAEIVANAGQWKQVTVATNMAGRGTDIRLSEQSLAVGGMHVVISELHESERIDRQLIGRCGRQGDPGSYRFFMSLEDDILETGYGPQSAKKMKAAGNRQQNQPAHKSNLFRQAQSRIEKRHFRSRKMLLLQEQERQTAQRELGQDPYVDTIS